MDPKKKEKTHLIQSKQEKDADLAGLPQMAPPEFTPTAEPIQKKDPTESGPGIPTTLPPALLPQVPNYQLTPPTAPGQVDPELMRRMALIQRLRQRTPLVGGLLSEEQILNLWHTPSDSTYEWDNGESGHTWDLYGPEQMDEQIQIGEMLRQLYPIKPGWETGFNGNGLGGTQTFENGTSLDLGIKPHSPEDMREQFPWLPVDEDAPMFDGATFGATYHF